MALAKKQEELPLPTLVERFKAAHAEMVKLGDELIQSHVDYLKACHKDLPRVTLEMDLYKHRSCTCAVALEVAGKASA